MILAVAMFWLLCAAVFLHLADVAPVIDLGHGQYTNQVVIAGNYVDTTGAAGAIGATGSTPHPSCAAGSSLTGNVDMVSGNPVNFYYSNTSTNC